MPKISSAYTVTADQLRASVATKTAKAAGTLQGKSTQDLTAGTAARVTVAQSKVAQANGYQTNIRVTNTTLSAVQTQMDTIRGIYQDALDLATQATNPQLKQSDRQTMNSTIQGLLAQAQNIVNTYTDPLGNKPLSGAVMGVANTGAATTAVTAMMVQAVNRTATVTAAYTAVTGLASLKLTAAQTAQLYNLSLTPNLTVPEFLAGSLSVIGATQGLDASALQPNLTIATKISKICALLPGVGGAVAVANAAAAAAPGGAANHGATNNLIALLTNTTNTNTTAAWSSNIDLTTVANKALATSLSALLSPADIAALNAFAATAPDGAGANGALQAAQIFAVLQKVSDLSQITDNAGAALAANMISDAGVLDTTADNGATKINQYVLKAAIGAFATATTESVQVGFATTDTYTLNIPNCSNFANGVSSVNISGTNDTDISGAQTAIAQLTAGMAAMDRAIALVKVQEDVLAGRTNSLNTNIQNYSNDISTALDADPVDAFSEIKLLQTQSEGANLLDLINTESKLSDAETAKAIAVR